MQGTRVPAVIERGQRQLLLASVFRVHKLGENPWLNGRVNTSCTTHAERAFNLNIVLPPSEQPPTRKCACLTEDQVLFWAFIQSTYVRTQCVAFDCLEDVALPVLNYTTLPTTSFMHRAKSSPLLIQTHYC